MKQIAYTVTSSGIDGREPTRVAAAFFSEVERDEYHKKSPNAAWHAKAEQIVHVEKARELALAKLDGVDRLVLNLPAWPAKLEDAPKPRGQA